MKKRVGIQAYKEAKRNDEAQDLILCVPSSAGTKAIGDPSERVREFILSSASIDRDGDSIDQHGWDLKAFQKSGVFLWAHDNRMPPIGDPIAAFVEPESGLGDVLKIRVRFPDKDMPHPLDGKSGEGFGHTVMRMFDERLLKAVSAGFIIKKAAEAIDDERPGFFPLDIKEAELLEGSAVPVPSNRDALVQARAKGIGADSIANWYEDLLSKDPSSGLWTPEPLKEALDADAKARTSVSVPDDIKAPEGEVDKDLDAVVKAAIEAEAEQIDRMIKTLSGVSLRGRALCKKNEDKLVLALDMLAKTLGLIVVSPEHKAQAPEKKVDETKDPVDTTDDKVFDIEDLSDDDIAELGSIVGEAADRKAADLHFQTTGGLS